MAFRDKHVCLASSLRFRETGFADQRVSGVEQLTRTQRSQADEIREQ